MVDVLRGCTDMAGPGRWVMALPPTPPSLGNKRFGGTLTSVAPSFVKVETTLLMIPRILMRT